MITLKNISNFLEGNTKMMQDGLGFYPAHLKEQIAYRMLRCTDCMSEGKCMKCGCKLPGKLYVAESCNKDRFPDLMSKSEWDEYRKNNGIE